MLPGQRTFLEMNVPPKPQIPPLFLSRFTVDDSAPFQRHLNRLEVEIGQEDYRHLKRVELLEQPLTEAEAAAMLDITERLLATTQNNYNRNLLMSLGIRVLLDEASYRVYYLCGDRTIRFVPLWREKVLKKFFGVVPLADSGWRPCRSLLPDFEARFLPDAAGGALLLRRISGGEGLPLLTATHGPYDPHTLEVALYFLRTGKGGAATVNLGFAGREPLTDANLRQLQSWGVPLNPSNIDVIYPYVDEHGHPNSYKMESGLRQFIRQLGIAEPQLILDIHGCVGTCPEDRKVVVGLGGLPPFCSFAELGRVEQRGDILHLFPATPLERGLHLVRELSEEVFLQFCTASGCCYHFAVLGGLQALGRRIDLRKDIASLLKGEERTYLPADMVRWLPGAGANALQRIEARKLPGAPLCLHVEIPTAVRRKMVVRLQELAITDSLSSSGL
ncbi:hypothetical protein [Geothermobacter hydrogeniphilus]|uniref:Uncharacterized protein n=1 Tax=Geothermobacter hydrogeniphilus TaxID=1969733 RepID=A0A1X0Y8B9_9BACT|nr:hypothetical protein [Geothermobacter hydrogeniphilus]ORJ61274.1 hypothetical protein B5V00_06450 [Geothermobacter hydrogeniphilus]